MALCCPVGLPVFPNQKDRLALSDSEFGLALLGIALGSVPAMLLITCLLRRVSDIAVCSSATLLFPTALPLINLTTNLAGLTAVLMLLGAASGALDVAMNTLAVRLQEEWQARILGRLHGAFSLGVLAGTAGAAVAIRLGASVGTHFAVGSVALLAALTVASVILYTRAPRQERVSTPHPHRPGNHTRNQRLPCTFTPSSCWPAASLRSELSCWRAC